MKTAQMGTEPAPTELALARDSATTTWSDRAPGQAEARGAGRWQRDGSPVPRSEVGTQGSGAWPTSSGAPPIIS